MLLSFSATAPITKEIELVNNESMENHTEVRNGNGSFRNDRDVSSVPNFPRRTHLSCTTLKKYLLDYDHSIGI